MPGTAAVVNAVVQGEVRRSATAAPPTPRGSRSSRSRRTPAAPAIAPARTTIKDGTYPLSRPLFFYLRAKPSADIKAFIDWVLSPEGQAIVDKVGYFPIK